MSAKNDKGENLLIFTGIIDILHLQPQDLGVDQIVIDDIQRRSHRIMMEYNIYRR